MPTQPPYAEADRPHRKRLRWLPVAWGVASLVAVVLVATYLWNLKYNKYRNHDYLYGVQVTDRHTEEQAGRSRTNAIARVKQLRDEWQPWAFQHHELLIQMMAAGPNDWKTLNHVYNALPLSPINRSLMPEANGLSQGEVGLTWQPLGKLMTPAAITRVARDPDDKARQLHLLALSADIREKQFARFRDVLLSDSASVGMAHVSLWVSGRVTETKIIRQFTPGSRAFAEGPTKELLPPYDFLRVQKENKHGQD